MTQESRKNPRARIVSLNVRYKSANVDEFIENHSLDVSRGGVFVKTPNPFSPGTLLKFEIRIQGDQTLIAGVGRVVWERREGQASEGFPPGMGIKFIKLEDDSRALIERIATSGVASGALFEQVQAVPVSMRSGTSAPRSAGEVSEVKQVSSDDAPKSPRVASNNRTILGLGEGVIEPPAVPSARAVPKQGTLAMFPKTDPDDLPAPEDRTVMRQAREFLEDALREAGGSLEEIGEPMEMAVMSTRFDAPKNRVQKDDESSSGDKRASMDLLAREAQSASAIARGSLPVSSHSPLVAQVVPSNPPKAIPTQPSPPSSRKRSGSSWQLFAFVAVVALSAFFFVIRMKNRGSQPEATTHRKPPPVVVESAVVPDFVPPPSATTQVEPVHAPSPSAAVTDVEPAPTPVPSAAAAHVEPAPAPVPSASAAHVEPAPAPVPVPKVEPVKVASPPPVAVQPAKVVATPPPEVARTPNPSSVETTNDEPKKKPAKPKKKIDDESDNPY